MNLWPFRVFISNASRGKAWDFVARLRELPTFSRARFDVYLPQVDTAHLIVCLGQMHTVLTARGVWWWTGWRIAMIQARLFTYFFALYRTLGIATFGLEGLTRGSEGGAFYIRFPDAMFFLGDERAAVSRGEVAPARGVLRRLAREWRDALAAGVATEIARHAELVAGSRLLAAVEPDVAFYPVESRAAHGAVWDAVQSLEAKLHAAEAVPAFIAAKAKGFKKLTKPEYDAAVAYRNVSEAFNKALRGSGARERASLTIAMEVARRDGVAAFVMGQAHRRTFLRLAPKLLGAENIGFVFITPPELWWWSAAIRWVVMFVVLAAGVVAFVLSS